jgi:hypothetical protein
MGTVCYVKDGTRAADAAVGSYVTSKGSPLKVYRAESSKTGKVFCANADGSKAVELGTGREELIEITSNDAIFDKFYYCGGASLFRAQRVTLENGTVVFSSRLEVTDMPVVK